MVSIRPLGTGNYARGRNETSNRLRDWVRFHLPIALNGKSADAAFHENGKPGDAAAKNTGRSEVSASVSRVFETKLGILKEAIAEIESGLGKREKLNKAFEKQIDGEISECQDLLGKLPYPWREGFLPKMEFLRVSLHKSLLTRRKDKRAEQLSYWDDVTSLLEKKRDILMEYQSLISTRDSLEET